jgi:hypothetical protein
MLGELVAMGVGSAVGTLAVQALTARVRRTRQAQPSTWPGDAPEQAAKPKRERGLYGKYHVERTDGSSEPGKKHEDCAYFVLDLTHDRNAPPALIAYAAACEAEYPVLARDLRAQAAITNDLTRRQEPVHW